ncbi:protein kinase domain-containing protein, partial [Streptomyces sp. ODS05-4]|uniref:protein kinase domain-containing protein n=1 Tax=Streptomyces sp. ODS05-4 TaxID=2944939 RepID=UPI00210EC257
MGEVLAGRYELVDPIGRGGAGEVWRAWDHRRRRYVAAKVLRQSDAHTLLRFVREQAVRIEHPHVLAPASWAADDDRVLFTMDLVRGGSLAQVIGDYGALPPRLVGVLLDQVLAGLAAVHAAGLVHRDVKPANLLLEATGTGRPHLRLTDFGIAMRKGEPRLTETDHVVGTPGYFAPEQLAGAEPDFPADLYAAGLVALHLLLGHRPDAQALAVRLTAPDAPTAPAGVPDPLWQVLAGLLHPEPRARFRTAADARAALTSAAALLPSVPEGGDADEPIEIFDQLPPLPDGFGPDGPKAPQGRENPQGREAPQGWEDPQGRKDPHAPAGSAVTASAAVPAAPVVPVGGGHGRGTEGPAGSTSPQGRPSPEGYELPGSSAGLGAVPAPPGPAGRVGPPLPFGTETTAPPRPPGRHRRGGAHPPIPPPAPARPRGGAPPPHRSEEDPPALPTPRG